MTLAFHTGARSSVSGAVTLVASMSRAVLDTCRWWVSLSDLQLVPFARSLLSCAGFEGGDVGN